MTIPFSCPSCDRKLNAKDKHAGRTLNCPACKTPVSVPQFATPSQPVPAPIQSVPAVVVPTIPKQVFCTNCGNSISEQAAACMSCGAKPTGHKKFCRHCGVALNPEQIVCIKCGTGVSSAGSKSFGSSTTVADITILVAAALAFISFLLPWLEATVPIVGKVSKSGFSVYAFWLGIFFIYPVWLTLSGLAGKRTPLNKGGGFACAGLGIVLGIAHVAWMYQKVFEDIDGYKRKMAEELTSFGPGVYLFFCACVVLIVGIVLTVQSSTESGSDSFTDSMPNTATGAPSSIHMWMHLGWALMILILQLLVLMNILLTTFKVDNSLLYGITKVTNFILCLPFVWTTSLFLPNWEYSCLTRIYLYLPTLIYPLFITFIIWACCKRQYSIHLKNILNPISR
ncbi:MAG: zinc ribbon domain-containing protein [Planctomycetaceae bacterium]|nr:zinc ribbon domain-containing protein [Planctomycetaceae bacterium]